MKKSLLALAVLGAFAGAASAQSSVTVYGIVDTGITSSDLGGSGVNGRQTSLASGNQSASRIGFKGTEDLGNGLKANFVLEAGFGSDNGSLGGNTVYSGGAGGAAPSSALFSRVSTVGLSGNFGAINAGRQTSLLKDAHDQIDPFGAAGVLGNVERIFYNGSQDLGGHRVSNSVKYTSNSFGGFKAGAQYSFGETRGDSSANQGYGFGLGYANGPLNVQFGYNNVDNSLETAPAFANVRETENAFLGATYNFGGFKLHGAYADSKRDNAVGADLKTRNAMVGVSVPFGAGTLLASYAINDNRTTNNADSKQVAIGYTYDLSKRTNLYTGYARTSNDAGAALGGGSIGATPVAGNDVSVVTVGVRHKF